MISANGIESAPADLLTYFMAKSIKDQFGVVTDETDMSLYHIKYVWLAIALGDIAANSDL